VSAAAAVGPQDKQSSVSALGERVLSIFEEVGAFGLLALQCVRVVGRRHFPMREIAVQFEAIAIRSLSIVTITALFTGMVLALQTVVSLSRFGAKPYTGSFVGLAFVLELGPVLTALMVSGRVGAGITAEIGSMTVTEQVDAIRAMGADPVQKLVLPRVVATTLGLPLLTILADILGILGGMLIAHQSGITTDFYLRTVAQVVTVPDLLQALTKTFFFGWTIAMVGCYTGLNTSGGTVGVGQATTRAVVVGSISVFILDFFLTKLMMML
jgi:phospholipid/cholesterol/gamma-HCH transport system permease protein